MERDLAELFLSNFIYNLMEINAPLDNSSNQKDYNLMQKSVLEPKPRPNFQTSKPIQIKKSIVSNAPQLNKIQKKIIKPHNSDKNSVVYKIAKNQISTTDKLNTLMRDPYINEIECLGMDVPLIVHKSGTTQKTQVQLNVDEIYEIIAEFSQKTRIPVINGKIKAALNDLIITAVFSETLGPRFIIQKKMHIK